MVSGRFILPHYPSSLRSTESLARSVLAAITEHMRFQPRDELLVNLFGILIQVMGHHGYPAADAHQKPHRWQCLFAAALICRAGFVRHEMKVTSIVVQMTLFDLVGAHIASRWQGEDVRCSGPYQCSGLSRATRCGGLHFAGIETSLDSVPARTTILVFVSLLEAAVGQVPSWAGVAFGLVADSSSDSGARSLTTRAAAGHLLPCSRCVPPSIGVDHACDG